MLESLTRSGSGLGAARGARAPRPRRAAGHGRERGGRPTARHGAEVATLRLAVGCRKPGVEVIGLQARGHRLHRHGASVRAQEAVPRGCSPSLRRGAPSYGVPGIGYGVALPPSIGFMGSALTGAQTIVTDSSVAFVRRCAVRRRRLQPRRLHEGGICSASGAREVDSRCAPPAGCRGSSSLAGDVHGDEVARRRASVAMPFGSLLRSCEHRGILPVAVLESLRCPSRWHRGFLRIAPASSLPNV